MTALRSGAAGFLLKNGEPGHLVDAVRGAAAGEVVLCPVVTRQLVDHVMQADAGCGDAVRERLRLLTGRELEVLLHVAKGMSNAAIARHVAERERDQGPSRSGVQEDGLRQPRHRR